MAFQLVNFGRPLNLPPVGSSSIDWSGALTNALNIGIKMRQLGLEAQWKERSAQLAEKEFGLAQQKTLAEIDMAEKDQSLRYMQWEAGATKRALEEKKARAELESLKADAANKGNALAAKQTYADIQLSGGFDQWNKDKNTLEMSHDPFAIMEAAERLSNQSVAMAPVLSQISTFSDDLILRKDTFEKQNIVGTFVGPQLQQVKRHSTRRFARTIVSTESPDASIRALNGRNYEDASPDMQAKILQASTVPETRTTISETQEIKYSTQDLFDGIGAGKLEHARIFLRDSADKNRAMDYLNRNFGGDKSELMLHDDVPATPEYAMFKKMPGSAEAFITAGIAKMFERGESPSGQSFDVRVIRDPKTGAETEVRVPRRKTDGSPMTNMDALEEAWNIHSIRSKYPETVVNKGRAMLLEYRNIIPTTSATAPITKKQGGMFGLDQKEQEVLDEAKKKQAKNQPLTVKEQRLVDKESIIAAHMYVLSSLAKPITDSMQIIRYNNWLRRQYENMTPEQIERNKALIGNRSALEQTANEFFAPTM